MNKWWRAGHFYLMGLGWQGMLGSALVLGSALLVLFMLLPQRQHAQQLEQDVAQLRNRMKHHKAQWIDRSPQATLKAFYRFLPQESTASTQVEQVFEAADANGIDLDEAEYTMTRDRMANLSRYQVTLPVHGRYTDIRFFVIDLLNSMPALAINELTFKREDIHTQEVEARLRLTIYLGRGV